MKIIAYKNSKIKLTQIVNRNDIEDYLKDLSSESFDEKKLSNIKASSCSFSMASNEKYDLFAIEDYPFHDKKVVYFSLDKKSFNNSTDNKSVYTFDLKLNVFLTFSFGDLFNNRNVHVANKHINEKKEFEDFEKLELKENNIFQFENGLPNEALHLDNKQKNKILTREEKDLTAEQKKHYFNKWVLAVVNKDQGEFPVGLPFLYVEPKFSEKQSSESFAQGIYLVAFPFTTGNVNYKITDPYFDEDHAEGFINANFLYNKFNEDDQTLDILILDYCPFSNIEYTYKEDGSFDKLLFNGSSKWRTATFEDDEVPGLTYQGIFPASMEPKDITKDLFIETQEDLFKWTPETNQYNGEDDNFKKENSIILNFAPYKYHNIGIYSETNTSGWEFSLNNLKSLDFKNGKLFNRQFNPSGEILELTDDYKDNIYFGENIQKTKRNMFLPIFSDKWQQELANKRGNGLGDYLMPTLPALASWLIPGGAAVKVGAAATTFLLGAATTGLRRQRIKNTPDTRTQAATDTTNELVKHYETRTLTTFNLHEDQQDLVAWAYHYLGYLMHDKQFNFNEDFEKELYNTRERFNVLKISDFETLRIFDNSNIYLEEVLALALDILRKGIHFHNYKSNWTKTLKEYLFNYEIKNPISTGGQNG